MSIQTSLLDQVDGSARLKSKTTDVLVSVTGPIEPKPRQELPTQAGLEIIVRPSRGLSSTREKVLEDYLRSVLQSIIIRYKYPRQLIQIVVQFVSTDVDAHGSIVVSGDTAASGIDYTANELCAALNCSFMALIDANVALYNSFAAVSLAVDQSGNYIENPSLRDLQNSESHHVICFDIRELKAHKILLVESNGSFTQEQLFGIINDASSRCEKLHKDSHRPAIESKLAKDYIWSK